MGGPTCADDRARLGLGPNGSVYDCNLLSCTTGRRASSSELGDCVNEPRKGSCDSLTPAHQTCFPTRQGGNHRTTSNVPTVAKHLPESGPVGA